MNEFTTKFYGFNSSLIYQIGNKVLFKKKFRFAGLKVISVLIIILVAGFSSMNLSAQTPIPNEAEWTGSGYALKKIVSNTSIQSGVNFSYTIMFSAPAGATNISITDPILSQLVVVNVPAPSAVNGVTPTVNISGTPEVNESVSYTLTGLPVGSASSGSFTIVVKFPEGTTCNGETARNRVCMEVPGVDACTPYVSTSAIAVDPWKVNKSILSGAVVNPLGGSCGYMIAPDATVKYRLYVMKNSPYWGNVSGQINMTGAVVTDVLPAGAVVTSSTCSGISVGASGTLMWNVNSGGGGLLDAANPYAYYYCDIEVHYPLGSFPAGTLIYNQLTLDGTTCNQPASHTSNQTCVEVIDYTPNLSANFQKYISLANRVPGCSGIYTVVFCNNGTAALSAFNIDDVIPSGISVDKIVVSVSSGVGPVDLNINGSTAASGITTSYNTGTLGTPTTDFQLQMTSGTLPIGKCIYAWVYFTIDSGASGTITNCASFDGLANSLSLSDACVSFTVEPGTPKPCLIKDICSPQTEYEPGDILRFRVRVQNIGSEDITGATFQDILHSNFNYLGNEAHYVASTYSPPCGTGGLKPAGTTDWLGVNDTHSGNNLSWTLPDIPADCQLFYSAYCGVYGTSTLPYYFIEFDVEVDSSAMPGVTPNNYDISGGNVATTTSNTVNVLVIASFGQEVNKTVSTDGGATFASTGTVSPGSTARYQLNYKNMSNVPVTSLNLVDLLPTNDAGADWLVLDRATSRGSLFDMAYVTTTTHSTTLVPGTTISGPTISSTSLDNMCLLMFGLTGGCTPGSWGGPGGSNVLMDYTSQILGPNITLQEEFDVTVSPTATNGQTACNDFAAISTADFLLDGTPTSISLTPIAAPPICVTLDTASVTCCDSVIIERVGDPTGQGDCCLQISTDCEVKSIEVSVDNGTIASASWNCSASLPAGYVGQSNYTFGPNNCALDMINCFESDSTGTIMVTYTINFANGEECEKRMELDCGSVSCCDSIDIRQVVNVDGSTDCCIDLKTTCEVDSVSVSITNGTFSSNIWNCTTPIPTAAIGMSSYTFEAANCVLEMINCFKTDQTGLVVVHYVVYMANGEICERAIDMDCKKDVVCCDSIDVRQVVNAAGEAECCVELKTTCEVDSVMVSISNGTFSSNTWTCGTAIPTAAVGMSTYTFNAANCVVNMVNCISPDATGGVSVSYMVYFANGEKCEKHVQMDCQKEDCCEKVKLESVQKDGECCVRLVTDCEVESVEINVGNGVLSSLNWTCGAALPAAYAGLTNVVLNPNACVVDLTTCVSASSSSGIVTITYTITFVNGEKCEKSIQIDCPLVNDPCCADVDLKLKPKWPWWNNLNGMFTITNADPSVPICYVELAYTPAAPMTTGNLFVDGVLSTQTWNQTRIPASGNLSPFAVNTIKFNMVSSNYKGLVTVCVVKCDGTRCCFEFKWNKKTWGHTDIPIEEYSPKGKLVGVSISPMLDIQDDVNVKYVSFGFVNEAEVDADEKEFFAISGSTEGSEELASGMALTSSAYMGKHSAFFELEQAVHVNENMGVFNMVFANGLPKLGCTLFDDEGNLIAGGEIEVTEVDTVVTAVIDIKSGSVSVFEFVNLYPNPSQGQYTLSYITSESIDIDILVVNQLGQIILTRSEGRVSAGIHNTSIDIHGLPAGVYKTVLKSGNTVRSKSTVIK